MIPEFTVADWLLFVLVVAVILFFIYPQSNGDFDEDYFEG